MTNADYRRTPENLERLKKIGFQKGRAKTGGRQKLPEEIKDAMAEKTPEAVEVMYELMMESKNPMVRLKAAEYLLGPFVAKAPTQQNVEVKHTHTIADMLAEINQKRLKDESKIIDITPNNGKDDD